MITYVYRKRKTNLITLSSIGREPDDDKLSDELLYKLEGIKPEHVEQDLRPYQCLWLCPSVVFKNHPDVISYFEGKGYQIPQYRSTTPIDTPEIEKSIKRIEKLIKTLQNNKVVTINSFSLERNKGLYEKGYKKIVYSCDVYNYLSDLYGSDVIDAVQEYESLSQKKREILETLNTIPATERKAQYLNTTARDELGDEFEDILRFLPEWYRLRYKLVGFGSIQEHKKPENITAECTNQAPMKKRGDIDEKELHEKLIGEIYKRFELGEIYSGPDISEKLKSIYNELGIEKVARIKDLEEYFNVTKINYFGTSEYKLETRK